MSTVVLRFNAMFICVYLTTFSNSDYIASSERVIGE
jgi:hypothetical protein